MMSSQRLRSAFWAIGVPLLLITGSVVFLQVLWWIEANRPPPNPNPPNGTIPATLGLAAFFWLFSALSYWSGKGGDSITVAGFKVIGGILFIGGWCAFAILVIAYFSGCNIWPWEPAVCGVPR